MRHGQAITFDKTEDGVVAPDGVTYDSEAEAFHYGLMNLCGCGRPEEVSEFLIASLRAFEGAKDLNDLPLDRIERIILEKPNIVAEFVAHFFDSKGMLEHGGSVGGGWLTDLGKQVISAGAVPDDEENLE